jgi:hypothetical protein
MILLFILIFTVTAGVVWFAAAHDVYTFSGIVTVFDQNYADSAITTLLAVFLVVVVVPLSVSYFSKSKNK